MVRKILAILFVITVLVITQKTSYSQVVGVTDAPQPGINCGDPNRTGDFQKCCKSPIIKPGTIDYNNIVLNAGRDILQPLTDKVTNELIQQQKSIVVKACAEGTPSGPQADAGCVCIIEPPAEPLSALEPLCQNIKSPSEQTLCIDCSHNKSGAWTALGCFNGNIGDFIANNIMRTGIGLAGGISMLCIMLAAFQMQTSAGNAEKVKKAQEMMTNCITGLMVIIFSVLILKIIGVDILKIPGFS